MGSHGGRSNAEVIVSIPGLEPTDQEQEQPPELAPSQSPISPVGSVREGNSAGATPLIPTSRDENSAKWEIFNRCMRNPGFEAITEHTNQLLTEKEEVKRQLEQCKIQLNLANAEVTEREKIYQHTLQTLEDLRSEKTDFDDKLWKKDEQLRILNDKLNSKTAEVEEFTANYAAIKECITTLQTENESLTKKLMKSEEEKHSFEQRVRKLEAEVEKIERKNKENTVELVGELEQQKLRADALESDLRLKAENGREQEVALEEIQKVLDRFNDGRKETLPDYGDGDVDGVIQNVPETDPERVPADPRTISTSTGKRRGGSLEYTTSRPEHQHWRKRRASQVNPANLADVSHQRSMDQGSGRHYHYSPRYRGKR